MDDDTRFGLPLSLTEALRADPSPDAATLAQLLAEEEPASRRLPALPSGGRAWRAAFAGIALAAGLGAQAQAASSSLQGRWTMAPAASSFREDVTGPAPDTVSVIVTQDDRDRLAYELVERRGDAEVARGAYDVSFAGAPSSSSVDGSNQKVTAEKDARGDVVIRAAPVRGMQAVIRMRRTGRDSVLLEHDVEGAGHSLKVESISLVRIGASASN